jgi:dihydrofolate synthase/folylpolyglutamate synthase
MPAEAASVIAQVAGACGAPLIATPAQTSTQGTAITLALPGTHQRDNAAVAAAVLRQCEALGMSRADIVTALTSVEWPARLEWLRLPSGHDILIDAAHNPAGALALAEYVRDTTGPLPLVLGVMKDKDVEAIVRVLAPAASSVVATQVNTARALAAAALADRIRQVAPELPVEWRESPDAALGRALEDRGRAMAAGSIFLIGPLRDRLIGQGARPVRYPSNAGPFFLT